jgi:photosystem II stability/assembly factor-like uncharacterized protein
VKRVLYRSSTILLLLLAILARTDGYAQWKKIAPGLLPKLYTKTSYDYGGASCFQDGILWIGKNQLWKSDDTGKTWTKVLDCGQSVILTITFYDRFHGLVGTDNANLFQTNDGGLSWKNLNSTGSGNYVYSAFYIGSPQTIVFSAYTSTLYLSHDGGASFTSSNLSSGLTLWAGHALSGGSAYMMVEGQSPGNGMGARIAETSDYGNTWQPPGLQKDWDSYGFDYDKCDSNVIYLVNEDAMQSDDGNSNIFVSSDRGKTWTTAVSKKTDPSMVLPYICGAIVSVPGATFAATNTDGILRSTNKGATWKSIGGPSMSYDTRFLAVINSNTVITVDSQGSVWGTSNGGGDSVGSGSGSSSLSISPLTIFAADTLHCSDSVKHSIHFTRSGCIPPDIINSRIVGADSLQYHFGNSNYDSLQIVYAPNSLGGHTSLLILAISDGKLDTVILNGYNDSKPFSCKASVQSLFDADTLYPCESIAKSFTFTTSGCSPSIISQKITGIQPTDYLLKKGLTEPLLPFDSVTLEFNASDSGIRKATYEITFSDGTILSIPLNGYGLAPIPLTLKTIDQSTDTVGGSVFIPITINGFEHQEDIDLVVHYDPILTYNGSNSLSNSSLDIPTECWPGRSKLHIPQAISNAILGYAEFNTLTAGGDPIQVSFDSVTVLTAKANCQYILPAQVISTIIPPSGCGIPIISHFMRTGNIPQFQIYPNPTSGDLSFISSITIPEATITISDMIGVERSVELVRLDKDIPKILSLPLPNGVYQLQIDGMSARANMKIIIMK